LIQHGSEISPKDNRNITPCQYAAWNSNFECAHFLLGMDSAGGEMYMDVGKSTLLISLCGAIPNQSFVFYMDKILNILILRDQLKLNHQNIYGDTALHVATRRGVPWMILNLLHLGADPHVLNEKGQSPYMEAQNHSQSSLILPLFSEYVSKNEQPNTNLTSQYPQSQLKQSHSIDEVAFRPLKPPRPGRALSSIPSSKLIEEIDDSLNRSRSSSQKVPLSVPFEPPTNNTKSDEVCFFIYCCLNAPIISPFSSSLFSLSP
jgi:hypothetical protein